MCTRPISNAKGDDRRLWVERQEREPIIDQHCWVLQSPKPLEFWKESERSLHITASTKKNQRYFRWENTIKGHPCTLCALLILINKIGSVNRALIPQLTVVSFFGYVYNQQFFFIIKYLYVQKGYIYFFCDQTLVCSAFLTKLIPLYQKSRC